ncbi:MAG: type II toxin-antitoxin system RelE/ParE family toxin [Deltaproteobacteria bacterium]|nr:type II toxin-antitoxin system RelE/ParE family toxin [Deltaproteobacteria bacterium]
MMSSEDFSDYPQIGQEKKGDLAGVCVYKFKVISRLALLAYEFNDSELLLISIGSHQHFYRIDLFPGE